jgi:glycosyltransferase involved in cell wall biosynthesis
MAIPQSDTHAAQQAIEQLERRIEELESQLGSLRELTVRSYEGTPQAATELLRARRDSSYDDAFGSTPLISVRIGTFNGGDVLFERALGSVLRQTYANWEAIVVCDGPDPSTAVRIASLEDERIRCIQRPRNGPYPTHPPARWQVAGAHPFNEGFAFARGSWIAPIDQDDEWSDNHLEVLLAAAQHTRAEVAYGVARAVVGTEGDTYFGAWPPALGDFGFQAAIYHASLTAFLYDVNAHLVDEPADWNLARRMLEAGVRFEFAETIVTTYYVEEHAPAVDWWRERLRQRGRFPLERTDLDVPKSPGTGRASDTDIMGNTTR